MEARRDCAMKKGIDNQWELQILRARGERQRGSETCRDAMDVTAGYTWYEARRPRGRGPDQAGPGRFCYPFFHHCSWPQPPSSLGLLWAVPVGKPCFHTDYHLLSGGDISSLASPEYCGELRIIVHLANSRRLLSHSSLKLPCV